MLHICHGLIFFSFRLKFEKVGCMYGGCTIYPLKEVNYSK